MALFNISGCGDWEVSDVGEKMYQNFKKDNPFKKKNKSKKKNNDEKGFMNKKEKVNKVVYKVNKALKNKTITNGRDQLLKKTKKKLKKHNILKRSDDETPLTSFSECESVVGSNKVSNKKTLKRKHESTSTQESSSALKKMKTKVNIANPKGNTSKKDRKKKPENGQMVKIKHDQSKPKVSSEGATKIVSAQLKKRRHQLEKLQQLMLQKKEPLVKNEPASKDLTLREKMIQKLKAARFRFLNEQIYSTTSKEAVKLFRKDPEAFKAYHQGYKLQVKRWPLNPLDKIIKSINKMNKEFIIADFGCGEARLAKSVEQTVHSFDLVAANEMVTPCDMANVPLPESSVDVAVFCLSLMGTNLKDYLVEANRVLKNGGLLKIAEVESRFEDVKAFAKACEQFGFKKTWMDLSYNLFYFIDFKKQSSIKDKKKLPSLTLLPCVYKKR